jgi:alpha-beta hydrolase superfamily lysophospholipase
MTAGRSRPWQAPVRSGIGELQPALGHQGGHHQRDARPLLLISGGKDHTVPEAVTRATLKQYRHSDAITDIMEFPDRAHSLTIDSGWREVADATLTWMAKQSL